MAPGAVASLVCGIVGIVTAFLGLVLGIIALVMASKAKRAIEAEPGRYDGDGLASAGRILGIVGIVVGTLGATILMSAIVFVLVSNLSASGEGAPDLAFSTDEANDRITVIQVMATDPPLDWDDLEVEGGQCGKPSGRVDPGDVMQCNGPGTVAIRHVPSDTIVYQTQFND